MFRISFRDNCTHTPPCVCRQWDFRAIGLVVLVSLIVVVLFFNWVDASLESRRYVSVIAGLRRNHSRNVETLMTKHQKETKKLKEGYDKTVSDLTADFRKKKEKLAEELPKELVKRFIGIALSSGIKPCNLPGVRVPKVVVLMRNTRSGIIINYVLTIVYQQPGILNRPYEFHVEVSDDTFNQLGLPAPRR